MRYYVIRIAYNKVAQAEDRPSPQAFDTFDAAKKAFHSNMYQNILGETIGWYLCMIINQYGNVEMMERWEAPIEEPENEEEPTQGE